MSNYTLTGQGGLKQNRVFMTLMVSRRIYEQ